MPFIRYRCCGIQYLRMDTVQCTLSSWNYCLAVLVTHPPNANFNLLKNPPIGQTTTLQFHHHAKPDYSDPWLSPGQIEDLLNGKRTCSDKEEENMFGHKKGPRSPIRIQKP